MLKNHLALPLLLLIFLLPQAGWAKSTIAATASKNDGTYVAIVVNDAAITNNDLTARYRMVLLSSGLPDNPDNRSRLMPQIIRSLIDEHVQLQEANTQQVTVTGAEIDEALARIAKDNNVPGGDMRLFLKTQGIAVQSLETQAKAALAWNKIIQRQLRPRIEVSDDEVDEIINRRKANVGKNEYFINEIFLPVDEPEQERAVREFADKLYAQIKQTGAFGGIARQFSQGAGATNAGEVGWVQQGQLATELDAALTKSKIGDLIPPTKTSKGYHIIAVRDQRIVSLGGDAATLVTIAQIGRPLEPQTAQAVVTETIARQKTLSSCTDLAKVFPAQEGWQIRMMPPQPLSALPPTLTPTLRAMKAGGSTPPEPRPGGMGFMVLCSRSEGDTVDRNAIMAAIGTERLETLARGYLRDLKRAAYIDMRLQ